MVKQGDIIKINFNPQKGHEQAGYRPALVVSNNYYNKEAGFAIVCPITNTDNKFPLHLKLPAGIKTTGVVLCEHVRYLDVQSRGYKFVERVDTDFLEEVLNMLSLFFIYEEEHKTKKYASFSEVMEIAGITPEDLEGWEDEEIE